MNLVIEQTPDGWYEQLAGECRANGVATAINEYGTPVSVHWCRAGDHSYTVCPPSPREGADCLTEGCVSYDPSCDASIYFAPDDPGLVES